MNIWRGVIRTRRRGRPAVGWLRCGVRDQSDAGNAALELVILAPVIILLLCMVIAAGRISIARGSVAAAARDAARQASISRSSAAAIVAGTESANATLAEEGLNCKPSRVDMRVGRGGFEVAVGQPASVSATVSCRISLSDLLVPGLPGSVPLQAHFSSPLDPYRGRTLGLGPAGSSASPASGGI